MSDVGLQEAAPATEGHEQVREWTRWLTAPVVVIPAIILLVIAIYAPALDDWFATDDILLLRAARVVPLGTYIREAFDFRDFEPLHFYAYRPLYFISSAFMYRAFGMDPVGYHLTSLALHLVNVLLTYHVVLTLTRRRSIACLAAAIFGLHPVYFVTVAWISGINSVAATTAHLACTAALLAYDRSRRWPWLAAALAAYLAGLMFHQEMFAGPGIVLIYLLVRHPGWRSRLREPATLAPFLLFGVVLVAFLLVQGQATQDAGFTDEFAPGRRTLRLILGALAISAAPTGEAGFGLRHDLTGIAVAAGLAFAVWKAGALRGPLLFAIAWFASLLLLSVLFYDGFPSNLLQGAFVRKMYAAGPALAMVAAICIWLSWSWLSRHLHELALPAVAGVAAVLALWFVFDDTRAQSRRLEGPGIETKAFYDAYTAAGIQIPEGGTLYTAGVPFSLLVITCGDTFLAGSPNTLCYVDNLVSAYHHRDIPVEVVLPATLKDPAFLQTLRPEDRIFCYRPEIYDC